MNREGAFGLRLALAALTSNTEGMHKTVEDIEAAHGCYGCITRVLLDLLADLEGDDGTAIAYLEGLLAEVLDGADEHG